MPSSSCPARFGAAEMPTIEAIDLIAHPPERGRWLAPKLVAAIEATLERGEQSLLFLNRRGYAPLTLCRTCGHRFQCPNCTAWMVEHRLTRRLACHHCGHIEPVPRACPECKDEDTLVACGPGVERIADEVTALFPEAKTAVVTSDTIWSPAKAAEFVGRMEAGDIDIVVGTQLVTKGYHFPNLTLVGVVDADLGLEGGDLRAAERTFQQIRQVSGRAGRGEKPGHVYIQTHSPGAQVMQALITGDADAFYAAETEARRDAGAPPFGRYAAIVVSSEDQAAAHDIARIDRAHRAAGRRHGGLRPRPRPAGDAARAAPLPPAGPRAPRARRAGRDPRLAGRARLAEQGSGDGGCRPVQLPVKSNLFDRTSSIFHSVEHWRACRKDSQ